MSDDLISEQRLKYESLAARISVGKASQDEAVKAIIQLCKDNERLALIAGKLRADLDAANERAETAEAVAATAYGASLDWEQILQGDALWAAQDDIAKSRVACMAAEADAAALRAQVQEAKDFLHKALCEHVDTMAALAKEQRHSRKMAAQMKAAAKAIGDLGDDLTYLPDAIQRGLPKRAYDIMRALAPSAPDEGAK